MLQTKLKITSLLNNFSLPQENSCYFKKNNKYISFCVFLGLLAHFLPISFK